MAPPTPCASLSSGSGIPGGQCADSCMREADSRQTESKPFFSSQHIPGLEPPGFPWPDGYTQQLFFSKCGQCFLLFIQIHNWTINDTPESPVSGILFIANFKRSLMHRLKRAISRKELKPHYKGGENCPAFGQSEEGKRIVG